jgi:hypothetical protein
MLEKVPVIVAAPFFRPLANPVASTEAMPVFDEVHCADAVTSFVVPSEYFAVAVNG